MLTDWFTVVVQGINFLILVGLLSRFLFTPIIRAMDKREADIADTLFRAREKERLATEAEEELEQKHRTISEERDMVLTGARQQAKELERELAGQAREQVDRLRRQWEEDLRRHQDRFLDRAAAAVSDQVMQNTDRVLRELSGRDLGQAVLDRFLERLTSKEDASRLKPAPSDDLVLRTTFPLDEQSRERIRTALGPLFPHAAKIRFDPSLQGPAGIELTCGSHRISWSIENHLSAVRNELNGLLTMDEQPS